MYPKILKYIIEIDTIIQLRGDIKFCKEVILFFFLDFKINNKKHAYN